ncbi:GspE/PulE family protein [Pectinatus sottacetonis]|uniref:GspE/PulE family protein n=1 Tax=Pectinatus sottacetonis TaxID=1002795 RepID=UPI0018C85831|nr:GspE/PulE family protein [Pectinatus sottacetonis]
MTISNTDLSLNELADKTLRSFDQIQKSTNTTSINISSSPIVELVNKIINDAIFQNASDIHIEPTTTLITIRLRIDGVLNKYASLPISLHPLIISRLKILGELNIVEKRQPQDGNITYTYKNKTIDIRISTIPTIYGEKMVMRLLNTSGKLLSLEELALSPLNYAAFNSLFHRSSGLILNTGPVNSGKTTTLYAALKELNTIEKNIVTIEDPVEYKLNGINQVQVNEKTGLTFEKGLRAMLRQDPDILLIGEIRDSKTAEAAVRAALTGHLILSTLHTKNAASAVLRMLDLGIKPYLLAATLSGCLSQRLLRRICPYCREKYLPATNSPAYKFMHKQKIPPDNLFHGRGCPKCNNSGYLGQIAVQEIFSVDSDIKQAIYENTNIDLLTQLAVKNGMRPLISDAIDKVKQKQTTIEEIIRIMNDY